MQQQGYHNTYDVNRACGNRNLFINAYAPWIRLKSTQGTGLRKKNNKKQIDSEELKVGIEIPLETG